MIRPFRAALSLAAATLLVGTLTSGAQASLVLAFGQTGVTPTIVATNNGAGSTTIAANDAAIVITAIDPSSGLIVPSAAFLTLNATSISAASISGLDYRQNYAGTFSIRSATGGGGTNILSGVFSDTVFGSGSSLTMSVSDAPDESVTFTSDIIAAGALLPSRAFSLAFSGVTPDVSIDNGSLASFTASVAGNASANINEVVPEPVSVLSALSGVALLGVGSWARRRRAA